MGWDGTGQGARRIRNVRVGIDTVLVTSVQLDAVADVVEARVLSWCRMEEGRMRQLLSSP